MGQHLLLPLCVAQAEVVFVAAVVTLFQAAFVGGLLFFQLFGCGLGFVAAVGGNGAAAVSIVSPNKKYTALSRLAVLLVLSAARCLVSFLF